MKQRKFARRGICLMLTVLILFSALPVEGLALSPDETDLVWKVEGDCLTVSGEIPDFSTFNDTAIPWLNERYHITKLVIEEGVTQIGDYAFNYMPVLTEVSLPGTLKRIGTQALSAAESLRTLELPESVETIGDGAFQGNAADMTLTVLNSACVFGYHPFGFHWDTSLNTDVVDEEALLRGYPGSTAAAYADETGVAFSPIGQEGWNPAWNVQTEQVDEEEQTDRFGCTHISTLEELLAIRDNMDGIYVLDNDINVGSSWVMPYGTFTGTLDGNGHQIIGLTLSSGTEAVLGFFQNLAGTVCNLSFTGVQIRSSYSNPCVGVIAGSGGGNIINCSVSGGITVNASGYAIVGGLTGGGGALTDCKSDVEISVSAGNGACVGAITGAESILTDCRCTGDITVEQKEDNTGAKFTVYGIYGNASGTALNCTSASEITVNMTDGQAYATALFGAANSVNTGAVCVTAQTGRASAEGGNNVVSCENQGRIYAAVVNGVSSWASAAAIGLNNAVSSVNRAEVTAESRGVSAYACGVCGTDSGAQEEAEGESSNFGPITASATQSDAAAVAVEDVETGGENSAPVTASSNGGKAVAYGIAGSSYMTNSGAVSATAENGSGTALACGLIDCSDSYNNASVRAGHTGTGMALTRGCSGCTRCVNTGYISATGAVKAGAVGVDECVDCSNSGSICAESQTNSLENSPSVYGYGYRDGSNSQSSGSVSVTGNACTVTTEGGKTTVEYTGVLAGNSTEIHATVPGFYDVTCTSEPVTVYIYWNSSGYQGTTTTAGVDSDTEKWSPVSTFAPGEAASPSGPEERPKPETHPNLAVTGFTLHRSANGDMIHSVAINCGSISFDTGIDSAAGLADPRYTDYSKLSLRVGLRNGGTGNSGVSTMMLTLPEGFSFSQNAVVQTDVVTLPDVPAGEASCVWVDVYPLYSESYQSGDHLLCSYNAPDEVEYTKEITACQVYMPQSRFDYAKVYYGVSELDASALVFKYFNWDKSAYLESSDRYQESIMRMSALLSQGIYLYNDDEMAMLADQMTAALGLSCVSIQGENSIMDYKRLYAKKVFVADGQVYELFITAVLGTAELYGWLGNLSFISTDKYHASFRSIAEKGAASLDAYVRTYSSGANVKYLVTGHSRGGGSANLLGAILDERSSISHDDVFCYTFAAPNAVRDDGELSGAAYKNIFNLVNFNDVVGYVPGCYGKYGVSLVYENELDTVSSLYISQIRQFSTDELLLGNADGLRLTIMLSFAAPQVDRILAKHLMPYYIEDLWVLDLERDLPISMEEANVRQDDIGRRYMDGVIDGGKNVMSVIGFLKEAGVKSVKGLVRATNSEKRLQVVLRKMLQEAGDQLEDQIDAMTFDPIREEVGRDLIRYGIMQLHCPVNVSVYDASGACVVEITNDELVSKEDTVGVLIENDRKTLCLPLDDQTYRLEVSGYANGTMDVQYYEVNNGETAKFEAYSAIPVQSGQISTAIVTPDSLEDALVVTDRSGKTLTPLTSASGDALTAITHTVSAVESEDVSVFGVGTYYHGAYTSLSSSYVGEDENLVFAGWYSDGTLLSEEPVLSVPVMEDLTVEARYSTEGDLPASITDVTNTAAGVRVRLRGLDSESVLVAAAYNGLHRMVGCAVQTLDAGTQSTDIPLQKPSDAVTIKVFLLDKATHSPLCSAYTLQ